MRGRRVTPLLRFLLSQVVSHFQGMPYLLVKGEKKTWGGTEEVPMGSQGNRVVACHESRLQGQKPGSWFRIFLVSKCNRCRQGLRKLWARPHSLTRTRRRWLYFDDPLVVGREASASISCYRPRTVGAAPNFFGLEAPSRLEYFCRADFPSSRVAPRQSFFFYHEVLRPAPFKLQKDTPWRP